MEVGLKTLKLPLEVGCPIYTEFLVKQNQGNQADLPSGRTLFLTRFDSRITESQLKQAFSSFGQVIKAVIKTTQKPSANPALREDNIADKTSLAHVVFEKADSLAAVLKLAGSGLIAGQGSAGIRRRTLDEMIPAQFFYADHALLKQALDEFMIEFDIQKEKERQEDDMIPDVDEDGFVRVKNVGNANRGMPHRVELGTSLVVQESDEMRRKKKKEEKKKRSEAGLDFYKFQLKQRTQEQVQTARKKQAEDEKIIEELKKRRKFVQENQ